MYAQTHYSSSAKTAISVADRETEYPMCVVLKCFTSEPKSGSKQNKNSVEKSTALLLFS